MCRYATITRNSTRRASQRFLNESSSNFDFSEEIGFLIKLTASLWVLVALTSICAFVSMHFPHTIRSHGSFHAGSLLSSSESSWRPGEYQSGECGALQDLNMRRADNGELHQLVSNPPPGFEVPYREP